MLQVSAAEARVGRSMLQAGTTPVTTAGQLQSAVTSGAKHIVVQQHLDLSTLQLAVEDIVLGIALNTTLSITVRLLRVSSTRCCLCMRLRCSGDTP